MRNTTNLEHPTPSSKGNCRFRFENLQVELRVINSICCLSSTGNLFRLFHSRGLAPAGNKEPRSYSLIPPPQWDGEENLKKKAKLVGCDKNSLTGQQREKRRK